MPEQNSVQEAALEVVQMVEGGMRDDQAIVAIANIARRWSSAVSDEPARRHVSDKLTALAVRLEAESVVRRGSLAELTLGAAAHAARLAAAGT